MSARVTLLLGYVKKPLNKARNGKKKLKNITKLPGLRSLAFKNKFKQQFEFLENLELL